jgi:hypothetical protein
MRKAPPVFYLLYNFIFYEGVTYKITCTVVSSKISPTHHSVLTATLLSKNGAISHSISLSPSTSHTHRFKPYRHSLPFVSIPFLFSPSPAPLFSSPSLQPLSPLPFLHPCRHQGGDSWRQTDDSCCR